MTWKELEEIIAKMSPEEKEKSVLVHSGKNCSTRLVYNYQSCEQSESGEKMLWD
jgi:hypothetical protein